MVQEPKDPRWLKMLWRMLDIFGITFLVFCIITTTLVILLENAP